VLVKATQDDKGRWVYNEDVYNTILYANFGVVGERTVYGADKYGRPLVQWVSDNDKDTTANGGKYIVNIEDNAAILKDNADYPTPGAWYDDPNDDGDTADRLKDGTKYSYTLKPVKVYTKAIDECTLVNDINSHRAIAGANVTEYLNGGLVATRAAGETIHALHTDDQRYVNAQGRTLEVYQVGATRTSGVFVFVYIDTMMGVVTQVVPHTEDTAGHLMNASELHVKINDTMTADVVATNGSKDYTEKVGDLVLIQTWGMKDDDGTNPDTTALTVANLNKTVPTVDNDFLVDNGTATSWGVERVSGLTTQTVTVNATTGTMDFKDGVITANGTYKANVVYLGNNVATAKGFYQGDSTTAINQDATTVPAPYNINMVNERIGQTYTIVLDKNGNVVGMTQDAAKSNIGVITGIDSVRIGTGRYAVEADMVMMDGSKQTVRFLDDETNVGSWEYFALLADADASIGAMNLKAALNVLVEVEPFTKDGATYHKVLATHDGTATDFAAPETEADGLVETGVADTLTGIANYNKAPTLDADNLDDNTRFIIAEIDYRYNNGQNNVGGYTNYNYTFYTGFKNIPTIEGDGTNDDILWQRIGNNVFIYPEMDSTNNPNLTYTMKNKVTVPVDETYLVVAPVATYDDHATYKVLKDGVETTLDVVNNNLMAVNNDVETAMAAGQLIRVDSRNTKGYVTAVVIYDSANPADDDFSRTIPAASGIYFNKTGVIGIDDDTAANANGVGTACIDSWLTVAEGCTVQIVNLQTGNVYAGTLDSIRQYDDFAATAGSAASHRFVYELDANGYVNHLYIID
ncbi:MAG: hypothetical protein NC131_15245, partial [Roseburia sp.]|nr:hypothetical protein [Roseburia sp.]